MGFAATLDKSLSIAKPEFNRWLIPPAALAVHLSIGQAYAFSVFNAPLNKAYGWSIPSLGWIFSLAIVFLGLSAAFGGKWLERVGPRATMFASALCFGGGFLVSALGIYLQQLWMLYLGYGVIGGIGLGLGYVSPVSTLIKWFPDRRGMATGLAIMGFGGGAMIGAPLAVTLMDKFKTATTPGIAETFVVMGLIYTLSMLIGAFTVRLPAPDWKPEGFVEKQDPKKLASHVYVDADTALKTPQFWLMWAVLCLNVTAGIGVLGQASLMIQEVFKGSVSAAAAAGFVGLLSIFNMGGRFFWSSVSDAIGRKTTYLVFLLLGAALYALVPTIGSSSIALFVGLYAVILSMYGGGFATIPAYLSDKFGTRYVGAIHGRLLTAWSAAGVLGPVIVNYMRDHQIKDLGVPAAQAYNTTMYMLAGLLVIGFVCNAFIKNVDEKFISRED
ncbi:MFS transporter [Silvimonas amylolytica]|uniref:MFS transporter n=1 Tax=Silvimonas amylolytica TaxID=449663 RepID=A0ABQ2PLA9_9NEIS|nr:MFS transporter [Silvimonas amylolytica]